MNEKRKQEKKKERPSSPFARTGRDEIMEREVSPVREEKEGTKEFKVERR